MILLIFQNTNIDIIEGINKLHSSVLTKACVLKGIVKDKSIGPDCTQTSNVSSCIDPSSDSFATSTPDQSINDCLDNNGFDNNSVDTLIPPSAVVMDKTKKRFSVSSQDATATDGHFVNQLNVSRRKEIYNKKLLEFDDERRDVITVSIFIYLFL